MWAAGLVFLTVGYFQNSRPNWGVNAQFGTACAVADEGTVSIDNYHDRAETRTGDKAFKDGHYYSDKGPVVSLAGAPVVWLYRRLSNATGAAFDFDLARYLATWAISGTAAAGLAFLLTLLLTERGVDADTGARASALWIAATPLMGYAVLFTAYLFASACIAWSVWLAQPAWQTAAPSRRRLFGAGLTMGIATWSLNTVTMVAVPLTVLVASGGWPARREIWRRLAPWCAGGAVGIAAYLTYQYSVFESFASAYTWTVDSDFRQYMSQGLMGATTPKLIVAWLLTFNPFQGLFFWWPLTLVAALGCAATAFRSDARPADRREGWTALAVLALFVTYVSAYFLWWGGNAYGPRHLLPSLPTLALGLPLWLRRPHARRFCWILGGVSAAFNIIAVAVDPQPPAPLQHQELMNPSDISRWPIPYLQLQHYAWNGGTLDGNWGQALGLTGLWSLVPLLTIWIAAWWSTSARRGREPVARLG